MGEGGSTEARMRTAVCDAGPVIHLHEAGLLPLGLPTREEAERSVNLAGKLLKNVEKKIK